MNTNRSFTPVLYGRKRKVRNLWQRGDIFYARIKIPYPGEETPKVRCIPLKAKTIPSAVKELLELQVKRDKGKTVVRGNTPTLAEYSEKYIDRLYEGNRKQLKTGTGRIAITFLDPRTGFAPHVQDYRGSNPEGD